MFAVIMAGGAGEEAIAQGYVCLGDPAAQAELLVIELVACQDAYDAAMAGPDAALAAAKSAHRAAVGAARAQWLLDILACAEGNTWCVMIATITRDNAIAAADGILAAANAAHFAALQAAIAARDACEAAAIAKYLFCTS